jgi:type IV secretory pathway TrbD component
MYVCGGGILVLVLKVWKCHCMYASVWHVSHAFFVWKGTKGRMSYNSLPSV